MGRQRFGDDVWSGYIIELYQFIVYEILDTPSNGNILLGYALWPQNDVHTSWTGQN